MATDSGKPSGSADSYIGSLISLISKSEVRYEGVLFFINTKESSIGLQNVKCYGTEGRKKDDRQIPPNDEVYEYILFRGSDIKDLQVKSSPPVYTATPIHNDPAIIQSHYARGSSTSTSLASIEVGTMEAISYHGECSTLPCSTFPGVFPSYKTGANVGPWSSASAPPSAKGTGLTESYWQGYYGPPSGLPHAWSQSSPFQSAAMPIATALQHPLQYLEAHASLATNKPNLPEVSPTAPTANFIPSSFSSFASNQIATSPSLDLSSTLYSKGSLLPVPSSSLSSNLLTMPHLTFSTNQGVNVNVIPNSGTVNPAPVSTPLVQSLPYPVPSTVGSSTSGLLSTAPPALVTPDQLLRPGPPSYPQTSHPEQNDMGALVPSSPKESSIVSASPLQVPLLPLPIPLNQQLDEDVGYSRRNNNEQKQNGVHGIQHSVTQFTEEFDFEAMNEKFNKDEVWGHLGKVKQRDKTDGMENNPIDHYAEDEVDSGQCSKFDAKPVYCKDEFFDSLSCNSLSRGGRNGRAKFSERMKMDAETFGDFQQRSHSSRGINGAGRRGSFRGSYYRGRGYGYGGRGRGRYGPI